MWGTWIKIISAIPRLKAMNYRLGAIIIRVLLIISAVIVTVSGIGIVEFRALEVVHLGKNLSHQVHLVSWIPFVVLLVVHMVYTRAFKDRLR